MIQELNILHPKLGAGWGAHVSLGQICREIANEFTRNPPQPYVMLPLYHTIALYD